MFVTEGIPSTQSVVHRVAYTKESLAKRGDQVSVLYGKETTVLGHRFQRASFLSTIRSLLAFGDLDALVVHRAADPFTAMIASIGRRHGIPVVFDLDDAIYLRWNILSAWARNLIRTSDAVTAGSHALVQYATRLNSNVHLVPSPVDTETFRPSILRQHNAVPTVGWMGDGRVHESNLKVIVEPLLQLALRVQFKLKLVSALGNPRILKAFQPLEKYIDVDYGPSEWMAINEIPNLMAEFDISLMPLLDTDFNRGKAGQKLLESMAMEIPVMASPVGENNYIVSHGDNGFLASNRDEWGRYLEILLASPELRSQMGKRGRRKVVDGYSRDVCFHLFTEALGTALHGVRKRGARARTA